MRGTCRAQAEEPNRRPISTYQLTGSLSILKASLLCFHFPLLLAGIDGLSMGIKHQVERKGGGEWGESHLEKDLGKFPNVKHFPSFLDLN